MAPATLMEAPVPVWARVMAPPVRPPTVKPGSDMLVKLMNPAPPPLRLSTAFDPVSVKSPAPPI